MPKKKLNKEDFVDDNGYYDYGPIFSRLDAVDMVQIWGARSVGKTYGLRKSCVEDYLKRGERFVEVLRYDSEMENFATGYFNKFEEKNEFPGYMFKVEAEKAYIAEVPKSYAMVDEETGEVKEKEDPPQWELFGYFVSLTKYQQIKKITFAKVRKIIFDEAAIEKDDTYHRYLKNEFEKLLSVFMTIAREEPGKKTRCKLFLLGNSCDLLNPYIRMLGITKPPSFGLSYYNGKTVLVHYVEPWDAERRKTDTAAGRLSQFSEDASTFDNEFSFSDDFVEKKSAAAVYMFGLSYGGERFGIWIDSYKGLAYISKKIPNNAPVIALTTRDMKLNTYAIEKNGNFFKSIRNMYQMKMLRYETLAVKEDFLEVLAYFGIK